MAKKSNRGKRYTQAEKEAVLAATAGMTLDAATSHAGVSRNALVNWRKAAKVKNRASKRAPKAANGAANDSAKGGRLRAVIREIVREELELQLK